MLSSHLSSGLENERGDLPDIRSFNLRLFEALAGVKILPAGNSPGLPNPGARVVRADFAGITPSVNAESVVI
jgi:hypothetical protein